MTIDYLVGRTSDPHGSYLLHHAGDAGTISLPIIEISQLKPIPTQPASNYFPFPLELLPDPKRSYFLLRLTDNSMSNAGLHDDAVALVLEQDWLDTDGEIMVIMDPDASLVRRVYRQPDGFILQPANGDYQPLFLSTSKARSVWLLGKVIKAIVDIE